MTTSSESPRDDQAVAVARVAFAEWLRGAREARGISLDEVARVTKIQLRTLEKLEEARFDQLPADVFVRGFLRNYARVVGLDAEQALARYDDCGTNPGPAAAAKARAMIETVAALAPGAAARAAQPRVLRALHTLATPPAGVQLADGSSNELATVPMAEPVVIAEPVVEEPVVEAKAETAEVIDAPKPKRQRGKGTGKGKGKGRGRAAKPKVEAEIVALQEPAVDDFEIEITPLPPEPVVETAPAPGPAPVLVVPPPAFRPRVTGRGVAVTPIPSLVIDDDDPESAERVREARGDEGKHEHRSFLPKALLDNERGRQGGLTLAVIILLIVATLTLSYLMRRPSAGGEGVTMVDSHATSILASG